MAKNKKDEWSPAKREFKLAWEEYSKNNVEPKNNLEMEKQTEDFMNWYNNIRKQSDTGKTPNQMYEEIYGKEPLDKTPDNINDELFSIAGEIFDDRVWEETNKDTKGLSRRELADYMFGLGFVTHQEIMDREIKEVEDNIKRNLKIDEKNMADIDGEFNDKR